MLMIGPLLGIIGVLIGLQLKRQHRYPSLRTRGIICLVTGILIMLINRFWMISATNIDLIFSSLFVLVGIGFFVSDYRKKVKKHPE